MRNSTYHMLLRVSALTLALVLLFVSGIVNPITKELSNSTGAYLATAIGMQASVAPTDLNQLTAQLTEQKNNLDKREAALSEREINVDLKQSAVSGDLSTFILSAVLFVLLVLIVLNYALDYLRLKRERVTAIS